MTPEEQAAAAATMAAAEVAASAAAALKATETAAAEAAKSKVKSEGEPETYAKEYVERLRREKADAETAVTAHKAEVAKYEKAKADAEAAAAVEKGEFKALYEKEKAARESAVAASNVRLLDAELKARAAAAGMNDPADALLLIDKSKVQISETGDVTDTASLFEALKTAKPYLFKAATTVAASVKGGFVAPVTTTSASDIKVDAFNMDSAAYESAWKKVGRKV